MRPIDLVEEWVREQDWIGDYWCCSLSEAHPCGVRQGYSPQDYHNHWPFVAIPLFYWDMSLGGGMVEFRIYADGVNFLGVVGTNYKVLDRVFSLSPEDPDFLGKLEGHVRSVLRRVDEAD